jgi:hypothetical protein
MQIKIVFDTGYELTVDLIDNDFVKRWCRLLSQELERGTLLQEDTFSNFIPESLARQRLEQSIDTVNKFLRREFISMPRSSDYDDPEFYNRLHEQFEKLAGPDWDNPARLMLVAPDVVKLAVRHINRYCHRLEKRPYQIKPEMRVEFNTAERCLLSADDYNLFAPVENDHVVLLDYSTLGKSLHECYEDGLPPSYVGLKIQHHYCANFILRFGKSTQLKSEQGFNLWLEQHNITNVPSATGYIQLGNIADKTSLDKVKQNVKIVTIKLE